MRYARQLHSFLTILVGVWLGAAAVSAQPTPPVSTSLALPAGIRVKNPCLPRPTSNTACTSDPTRFYDDTPGVAAWQWEFAPVSGTGISTSVLSGSTVTNQYTQAGTYTVRLTRTFSGTSLATPTIEFPVTIGNRPRQFDTAPRPGAFGWGADTVICQGQSLDLNPYISNAPAGVTYEWAPKGEITPTLNVTSSGCYSVEVTDALGCTIEDKIQVKVCPQQAQSAGSKWYFGGNAGIDFAGGGAPTPLTDGKLNTLEGASSITDTKGQLLFYTDGIKVYDKDGNIMPIQLFDPTGLPLRDPVTGKPIASTAASQTASLGGNQRSTQSALIVPKSTCQGCEYLYYVYTTSEINGTRQLTYSIIDMRKNDGKGALVDINLPVAPTSTSTLSTERSAAVQNERDSTYWVITRDFGGNVFRITHITKGDTPAQTTVAAGQSQTALTQGEGYLKFGPAPSSSSATSGSGVSGSAVSGTATSGPASNTAVRPVAMVVPGPPDNYVELFTFNLDTGQLEFTRRIDLGPSPPKAYGVEFSPDGKNLFISLLGEPGSLSNATSSIIRYDLTQTDPDALTASRTVIAESTTQQFGALQVGSDGRIYVAVPGQQALGVIENPNASFLESVTFTPAGQSLGGKTSQLGLPNQVANFNEESNGAGLSHEDSCFPDPVQFTIGPLCPDLKEQYTVNFGDNTAPFSGTTTQVPPHKYTNPGSYTATLRVVTMRTDGSICKDTTLTDAITILPKPDSFTLGNITACKTSVDVTIPVTAQNYAWVFGGRLVSRSKTITATRSGQYFAFAFNDPNCAEPVPMSLALIPPAQPFAPLTSPTICAGSSTTIGVQAAPIYHNFQWSNGTTDRTTTVSQPGSYTVTGSYDLALGGTCSNTAVVNVTQVANPRITIGLSSPTGCTSLDGVIRVPQVIPGGSSSYTFTFSDANGAVLQSSPVNSLTGIAAGSYIIKVADALGCSIASPGQLTTPANTFTATASAIPALCVRPLSGTVTLSTSGGTPASYNWRDATGTVISTSAVLSSVASGTYSVDVRDTGGCLATINPINVGLNTTGFADLGPDRTGCLGDPVALTVGGGAVPGNMYRWSSGQTTPTINTTASGTFSLTVSNPNGCVGQDAVLVTLNPKPTVSAGPALTLCFSNQPVQLTGNSPTGGVWSGQNISPTGSFSTTDIISSPIPVTYAVSQNGCTATDVRQIAVRPVPQVSAGPDARFCVGQPQPLLATGTQGAIFRWSDGTMGAALRPTITGRYEVTATLDGCDARDDTQITVLPAPQYSLTREVPLCPGDNGSVTLVVRAEPGSRYLWVTQGSTVSAVQVSQVGSYSVQVTGANGCLAVDAARVVDRCDPRLFIPEAFTPNGDGLNDQLDVFTAYTTDYDLKIYNRWGEVIFASSSPEQRWDGKYKGVLYPPMVYAYVISYRSLYAPDEPKTVRRGSVLLIR